MYKRCSGRRAPWALVILCFYRAEWLLAFKECKPPDENLPVPSCLRQHIYIYQSEIIHFNFIVYVSNSLAFFTLTYSMSTLKLNFTFKLSNIFLIIYFVLKIRTTKIIIKTNSDYLLEYIVYWYMCRGFVFW